MAKRSKKTKRGRPATGRTKAMWAARIAHDVAAYLRTQPSQAAAVEAAVRGTIGYMQWRGGANFLVVPPNDR